MSVDKADDLEGGGGYPLPFIFSWISSALPEAFQVSSALRLDLPSKPAPVSQHKTLPFTVDPALVAKFNQAIDGRFSEDVGEVVALRLFVHFIDSVYLAAADVGLITRAEAESMILRGHPKATARFLRRKFNMRQSGRPVKVTPSALRRRVKQAARAIAREGAEPKLEGVAERLGMKQAALSRAMGRKGISWREIKAEVGQMKT